jgi:protease-4
MDPDALEEIAAGRVWTGAEALERNLVDEVGDFRAALTKARELAGIPEKASSVLVKVSPPRNARPTPGEPLEEAVGAVRDALSELRASCVWALAPYDSSDDW